MERTKQYLLDDLSDKQTKAVTRCVDFMQAHPYHISYSFGLVTALQLQGIELPYINYRRYPRLHPDKIQIIVDDFNLKPSYSTNNTTILESYKWSYSKHTNSIDYDYYSLACTCPTDTWAMLARWTSLESLILLGSAILRRRTLHEPVEISDFQESISNMEADEHHKHAAPGIKKCRQAFPLLLAGTDSTPEVRTNLILKQHGLPQLIPNYQVMDLDGNIFYLDFAIPELKIAVEYDGQFHSNQWAHDVERLNKLQLMGWIVIQVNKASLKDDDSQYRLAKRVNNSIRERSGLSYQLLPKLSLEELVSDEYLPHLPTGRPT